MCSIHIFLYTLEHLGVAFHLNSLLLSLPASKVLRLQSLSGNLPCFPMVLGPPGVLGRAFKACVLRCSSGTPLPQTILWLNGNTSVGDRDMKWSVRQNLSSLLLVWPDNSLLVPQLQWAFPLYHTTSDGRFSLWLGDVLIPYFILGVTR